MTDTVNSLTVVLTNDMRADDIEAIENAVRMIKGVLAVKRHVADRETFAAEERALHQLRMQFRDILWPKN